jgi:hypothetical protein
MRQILQLSTVEANFTLEPSQELISLLNFNFREKVPQVMALLSLDHNLARLHAKISPKMDEEIFWRNYYARIWYLRYKSGIDSPLPQREIDSLKLEEVIFFPVVPSVSVPESPHAVAVAAAVSSPSPTKPSAASSPAAVTASATIASSTPPSTHTRAPATPSSSSSPRPTVPPSPSPPNTGSSSDWDTCDDVKVSSAVAPAPVLPAAGGSSKGKSTKPVAVAAAAPVVAPSQSQRLGQEIETMKKVENERIKKREAEAAALAAEVSHSPLSLGTSHLL